MNTFRIILLIIVGIVAMLDFDSHAEEREVKPTFMIEKKEYGYQTTFRFNGRIFYSEKTEKRPLVLTITSDKITDEMLENRKDLIVPVFIIERDYGVVYDKKGNGIDMAGNYVSYKRVPGVKKGSHVRTFFIYNPNNNYLDGIEARCDYIVRK